MGAREEDFYWQLAGSGKAYSALEVNGVDARPGKSDNKT